MTNELKVINEYFLEVYIRRKTLNEAGIVTSSIVLVDRSCEVTKEQVGEICEGLVKAGVK